jgi:hypothetical protein
MTQKKLQNKSLDGDGIVSDSEIEQSKQIQKTKDESRKQLAQRRMATATLIFMGCYAAILASPFIGLDRLEKLSAITDLLFISGSSIVGFYMGSTAYMSRSK